MPCLLAILALFVPRLVIVAVWLFSDYLWQAFQARLWPVLGFVFAPVTTLAYAWLINTYGAVSGWGWVLMILAVVMDLGSAERAGRRPKTGKS